MSVKNYGSSKKTNTRLLTLVDICEDLGITRSTFYDWRVKKKTPPCFKLPNGELRIRRSDYENWIDSRIERAA